MKGIIGRIDPNEKNVAIWGSGFSGLVLGHFLKKNGYRVTIYEKSSFLGGKIQTKKGPHGILEKGANALYLNEDAIELINDLKLTPVKAEKKLRKLLFINGRARRPLHLKAMVSLVSNIFKKPPLICDGLTVADFFRPFIGEESLNNILSPILGGIYATPAEQLHFKSIFENESQKIQSKSYFEFVKVFFNKVRKSKKNELNGSISFEGGMQTLIKSLADSLKGDIKLNYKGPFHLRGNTILCTDAHSASELLENLRPDYSRELSRVRYQELTSATLFSKREIRPLMKSFGILIPRGSGLKSIGIINNKAIFPSNHPNSLPYTFISPQKVETDDLLEDLRLISHDMEPSDIDHVEVTYWNRALPIYDLQRYLSIKKLHQITMEEKQFAIFGNYVTGISLREMISAARTFANLHANK
jgi:oxygen-dependent protoporphyrinogen oxidase